MMYKKIVKYVPVRKKYSRYKKSRGKYRGKHKMMKWRS